MRFTLGPTRCAVHTGTRTMPRDGASAAWPSAAALAALAWPLPPRAAPARSTTGRARLSRGSIEGTFSYVRGAGRERRRRGAPPRGGRASGWSGKLPPGLYRVISNQRPCDGNCGFLDPPADRCARRVACLLERASPRCGSRSAPRPRLHDERQRAACALPAAPGASARRSATCAAAAAVNSWALIDSWGRLHGFAPHRVYVTREPREGDAAHLLPARHRQPHAGRRRARGARAR